MRHLHLLALSTLLLPTLAPADDITLKDGKTLTGQITSEDPATISIRISDPTSPISLIRKVSRTHIAKISRPVLQGPAYVTLPVHGTIGQDVTAESFAAGLNDALHTDAPYILLDIDSPGGRIADLEPILASLADAQSKGHTVVAFVHDAYSAAAVLAMSCKQIYLLPNATLGAAVPYVSTKKGPADVDAKFRSALSAKQRAYVTAAGHDPLLLRAMMELDLTLYLDQDPTTHQPVLCTEPHGQLIKDKGSILTLTAQESAATGLSHTATDLTDLGKQLINGPWHEGPSSPTQAMAAARSAQRRRAAQTPGTLDHTLANLDRAKPDLQDLDKRMQDLQARSLANTQAALKLKQQVDASVAQIRADYDAACSRSRNPADIARAKDARDAALAALRQSTQPDLDRLTADDDRLRLEYTTLQHDRSTLLAHLSTD